MNHLTDIWSAALGRELEQGSEVAESKTLGDAWIKALVREGKRCSEIARPSLRRRLKWAVRGLHLRLQLMWTALSAPRDVVEDAVAARWR